MVEGTAEETLTLLPNAGAAIEEGPVKQVGALGSMTSVYTRDPDGNLLEFANYS